MAVDITNGGIIGPAPTDGHVWLRLGTLAPIGTRVNVTYGGGYTLGIPPGLKRACLMQAVKFLIVDAEPQSRQGTKIDSLDQTITELLAPWARTQTVGIEILPGNAAMVAQLEAMAARAMDVAPAYPGIIEGFHKVEAALWARAPWVDGPYYHELVITGTLEESLGGGGVGFNTVMSPYELLMTTSIAYAVFHDDGEGHNPLRPLVDVHEGDATSIVWDIIINTYVATGGILGFA